MSIAVVSAVALCMVMMVVAYAGNVPEESYDNHKIPNNGAKKGGGGKSRRKPHS